MYSYEVARVLLKNSITGKEYSDTRINDYAKGYVFGDSAVDARHKLEEEFKSNEYNRYEIALKRTDVIRL